MRYADNTIWLLRRITPHRRLHKPVGVEYWTVPFVYLRRML